MSSTAYSAEFKPDPRLRRLVAGSGVLLGIAGFLVILHLPTDIWMRLAACLLWVGSAARDHWQLQRGWADCLALRFTASGELSVLGADQTWRAARRQSGSVLLRKFGWIRLRDHRGLVFGELLFGDDRASPDWRRLQVIWRHVGA
ncbi:MAG: hypothetical protein KC572_03790 [Gammaproteobacteria bacterium]|nr:hypothetical protein [Gammaproteobacteria bacterium]